MDYQIVEDDTSEGLAKQVRLLLENGWTPQGGVSVVAFEAMMEGKGYSELKISYAQAMTKK